MNLGGMLDTVLSFALIMLLLSLLVESVLELIKRFFATKAKTMESLLVAMGENAIRDALVDMKSPPKPKGTSGMRSSDNEQTRQATGALQQAQAAAKAARDTAQQARVAAEAAKQHGAPNAAELDAAAIRADNEAVKAEKELTAKEAEVETVSLPLPHPMARGATNVTPEALKAELLRNATAVAESISANFSRRAELWDNAFQATARLSTQETAYEAKVGANCVLKPGDLGALDGLSSDRLQTLLGYTSTGSPDPIPPRGTP
jgi:hypothetical protein